MRRGIGDVKQRNANVRLNLGGHAVHSIAANDDEIGAPSLHRLRGFHHHPGKAFPFAGMLQLLDLAEIERNHHAERRMRVAKPIAHGLIDDPIIFGRAFPAHSAKKSDGLHSPSSGCSIRRRIRTIDTKVITTSSSWFVTMVWVRKEPISGLLRDGVFSRIWPRT
jgi:hypothetical protein